MRQSVSDSNDFRNAGFQKIVDGFLLHPGVSFASVLTAEKIAQIFRKHGGWFGENRIYNTAVVLWAFLGQVLRDGKEASCQSAVASIISFCLQSGQDARRKILATIVELEPSFPNRRSASSARKSPMTPNTLLTTPGCGKDAMQSLWMASHSPCPTRQKTRLSFLTHELRRKVSDFPSLAAS
jgi:hypothetical protein